MLKHILVVFALVSASSLPAFAAGESAHEAKHGGKVVQTNGHHLVEVVAAGNSIDVYVSHDDGEAQDVKEAKATATVLSGGKTEQIVLVPGEGNSFKGSGTAEIGPGAVIVVTFTLPRHKPEQARVKLD